MAQTAANLIDHVLPPVPLRQLVLTLPLELRRRLAYDGPLLGAVSRVFMRSVLEWYRRRMETEGVMDGRSGAVMAIQRCSSDLRIRSGNRVADRRVGASYATDPWRERGERHGSDGWSGYAGVG
jgi:hypothetical protein